MAFALASRSSLRVTCMAGKTAKGTVSKVSQILSVGQLSTMQQRRLRVSVESFPRCDTGEPSKLWHLFHLAWSLVLNSRSCCPMVSLLQTLKSGPGVQWYGPDRAKWLGESFALSRIFSG